MRLAFVDLETTGSRADVDRITEVGVVQIEGDERREWSTLINPETPISDFIERLTGISDDMVAHAPCFSEIAPGLSERLNGWLFVAHNARFDYGFLKAEFARVGIEFEPTVLCTVKLSRRLFPQHRKHNLDSLIERHGIRVDQRHRALGDARAIARFWQLIADEFESEMLHEAVRVLTAPTPTKPSKVGAASSGRFRPDGPPAGGTA
jgi:DNA polymerase-3 subunit epsilon